MEKSQKKGYLFCRIRGPPEVNQWEKRYYVLHGSSASNQPRLDFYNSDQDFRHRAESHGTMYIADIEKIRACKLKERDYTFELVLKTQKTRVFAADSDLERSQWIRSLGAVKGGSSNQESSNLLMVSGMVSLQGSQNSLDQDDLPPSDESKLYEQTENPDIFPVEVNHSPGSERNSLQGVFNLHVHTYNLMLCDPRSDRAVLTWPYRYIRRYGRSKTTFTFEAGRKCLSGEGYFTFKVQNGDIVFNSVQKRTKEMKKKVTNSPSLSGVEGDRSSQDEVSPAVPARHYNPDVETPSDMVQNRVRMFNTKPEARPKPKPPVLQKLKPGGNEKPTDGGARPSANPNPTRITQGYELARTVYPSGSVDQSSVPYADYDAGKILDVGYKESTETVSNGTEAQNRSPGNAKRGPGSPVYAVYDIMRSSRAHVYDTPADDPYYESAASVESATTTSSSFDYAEPYANPVAIGGDAWRRQGHPRDNIHIEHYDPEAGGVEADGIYEEPGDGASISAISNRLKQQKMDVDTSEAAYDRIDVHKLPGNPGRQGVTPPAAAGRFPRSPLPDIPSESEYGQLTPQSNQPKSFARNFLKKLKP